MKNKRWFPVVYMFIVTAFFSAIVIGFTRITEARVQANQEFAFESAVLRVLPDMYDPGASQQALHTRFVEEVQKPDDATAGAYVLRQGGSVAGYALPFSGQGFWAPIKGVLGISPDRETITGIAFYEQNETPGLGARITEPDFKEQFESLRMTGAEAPIQMKRPGEPLNEGQFHAVTGATQTSVRLERIINDALAQWNSKMKSGESP